MKPIRNLAVFVWKARRRDRPPNKTDVMTDGDNRLLHPSAIS